MVDFIKDTTGIHEDRSSNGTGTKGFLVKPVALKDMARMVRKMLDDPLE